MTFKEIHKFMKSGRIHKVIDMAFVRKSEKKKGKKKNGHAKIT